MKTIDNHRLRGFILAAVLGINLGFATSASAADGQLLIDLNSGEVTDFGSSAVFGTALNDAGQVVGYSIMASNQQGAFITGPNGVGMIDLGTLGGDYSEASGINAAGQVVGNSETAGGQLHAFITGPNGVGMTDLNSLVSLPAGVVLSAAVINNSGQVLASTTTIPEPQTYALMLAGLFLTGVMVRRKQKG
jgi:probable HAF family extracellular repeat protein